MGQRRRDLGRDEEQAELDERVIEIKRVAKVVQGGRRFAFRSVVVVGDNKGRVGIGTGKARGVPDSIQKSAEKARKNMVSVPIVGTTIPHEIEVKYGGAVVLLRPASPGTGVIAAGAVRAVCEAAGIHDILTKSKGSSNMLNVARATLKGLQSLVSVEQAAAMRDKPVKELLPFWRRGEA